MEGEQPSFKILVFPWLAHGHIFPLLELAMHLSKRRFHIYFCSTPVNFASIKTSIRKNFPSMDASEIKLVELPMPSLPELPPEFHTTKNLPSHLSLTLIKAFQMSSTSFADIIESLRPDLLIYDFLQPWAAKMALSKGIPCVFFAVVGAAVYGFYHHLYTGGVSSTFPYPAIYLLDHEKMDKKEDIVSTLKDYGVGFPLGNFDLSGEIVLMKSCRAVEGKYIDYLSSFCKKQIVPTGPLIVDAKNYDDDDEQLVKIMDWLSQKKDCSTVYISFGSEYFLSNEEIVEMAKGLEMCEANFIWVLRFSAEKEAMSVEEALPKGFLERVNKRGLVIPGWAPQTKILAHPSIGGFVSHCGWGSAVESIYFGVPIVAMPMKYEQPINARVVVEAGVSVEVVGKGGNQRYVGEEVAKAINKVFMEKEFYEGLRNRSKKLSDEMRKNEEQEMSALVEQLRSICMKNKT